MIEWYKNLKDVEFFFVGEWERTRKGDKMGRVGEAFHEQANLWVKYIFFAIGRS